MRLLALLEDRELSVADLTTITALPQSRVSTHLGKLREAGLVHDRRVGKSTRYRMHGALPEPAAELWSLWRPRVSDELLAADQARYDAWRRAKDEGSGWFDRIAGEMERHYSPGRTWESLVFGIAGLLELGDVLDIGCGDGWTARLLSERCRGYVGLDHSPQVIAAARERSRGLANVSFVEGDMASMPFAAPRFDHVLLMHVLPLAARPALVIDEASRVLRPGGRLVVTTLAPHEHGDTTKAFGHLHSGIAAEELRELLEDAGLRTQGCRTTSRERRAPHYEVITATAVKER